MFADSHSFPDECPCVWCCRGDSSGSRDGAHTSMRRGMTRMTTDCGKQDTGGVATGSLAPVLCKTSVWPETAEMSTLCMSCGCAHILKSLLATFLMRRLSNQCQFLYKKNKLTIFQMVIKFSNNKIVNIIYYSFYVDDITSKVYT